MPFGPADPSLPATVFLVALGLAVGLYAAGMGAMAWLAVRAARAPRPAPPAEWPRVAVLVAARNEEARLGRCLDALRAQDYPADRLDILVADDHSTDGTAAVIARYAAHPGDEDNPSPSVRAVRVPDATAHLRGKALAIHAAVGACDHDVLLVTDADCAPPPGWARALAAHFADPTLGMVCGHTWIEAEGRGPLAALQALDWAFLLASASVLAESGRPVTAMGNNMAFRRAAYEAVGGYPAIPFSVTEDYELLRAVAERSDFRIRFPLDPALDNQTLPLDALSDVYRQRRRWARGGLRARPWVYGIYVVAHLAHLLPLVALVVAPGAALVALVVKSAADGALLWAALGPSRRRGLLRAFPLFEGYLLAYMASLPTVLLFFPTIRWKERTL